MCIASSDYGTSWLGSSRTRGIIRQFIGLSSSPHETRQISFSPSLEINNDPSRSTTPHHSSINILATGVRHESEEEWGWVPKQRCCSGRHKDDLIPAPGTSIARSMLRNRGTVPIGSRKLSSLVERKVLGGDVCPRTESPGRLLSRPGLAWVSLDSPYDYQYGM